MLFNAANKRVYFTEEEAAKIEWSILNSNNNAYIQPITISSEDKNDVYAVELKGETIPNNNYAILKAAYKYDPLEIGARVLVAYLPLPIRAVDWDRFSGSTQIIYNHQGVP